MGNEETGVVETGEQALNDEQLIVGIDILKIKKGDTVVVHADASRPEHASWITQIFATIFQRQCLGPDDVNLLILPSNLDVKVLDEEQMKAQGWMRANKFRILTPSNGLRPH